MNAIRSAARRTLRRLGLHVGSVHKYRLVPRHFYSPIPETSELPEGFWERPAPTPGLRLDLDRQIDFAERELSAFLGEFAVLVQDGGFQISNRYFEQGDAELAYAMVRHLRPRRIIELGSGFSTLVLAAGAARNAADGHAAEYVACNPYPPGWLVERGLPDGLTDHRELPAQEVRASQFDQLAAGDILFVDTSHTVKLGGDVNFVVLEVLPRLASGVVVHFHDIWLPYPYHRVLVEDMGMAWAEQYLLQAYLAENPSWEILFATRALAGSRDRDLQRVLPLYSGANFPSSFWMRRLHAATPEGSGTET